MLGRDCTLPPPERVFEFLKDTDPDKRDKLIDILLASPEYIDYWTFRFADLYRVAMGPQGRSEVHQDVLGVGAGHDRPQRALRRNRPQAHRRARLRRASRHYYHIGGELPSPGNMMSEELRVSWAAGSTAPSAITTPTRSGVRTNTGGWRPSLDASAGSDSSVGTCSSSMIGRTRRVRQGRKVIHPRTKHEMEPTFLDGRVLAEDQRTDLRMGLAQWVTSQAYFDEAIVNRMWGLFFSRGIVDPVDDFRLTNPPTHPELLDTLARDFRENGHDLKYLIRLITQSRTYQLSSTPNETNKDDKINYSHSIARPLDPEVLLDAVSPGDGGVRRIR